MENVRNTQLYRTLLHEFGHYAHYLEIVESLFVNNEDFDAKEKLDDYYFKQLPNSEKEKFAHNYADKLRKELIDKKVIPFNRID